MRGKGRGVDMGPLCKNILDCGLRILDLKSRSISHHQSKIRGSTELAEVNPKSKIHPIALIILLLAPSCLAQDWSITTADFRTRPTTLIALSSDDVKIQFPGQPEGSTIPIDEFASLQRNSPQPSAPAKFTLLLRAGDRLTGQPLKVVDEQLHWHSNSLGEISIPLTRLATLGRSGDASIPAESPKQDVV